MKKLSIGFLVFMSVLLNAYGQDEKIILGVKGGLNIATLSNTGGSASASFGGYSSSYKSKAKLLPHLGVYSQFKISELFAIQPELLFTMKGYSSESKSSSPSYSSTYKNNFTLSYLEIPVQMRLNFNKFHILAGPYVGFLLAATSKSKSEVVDGSTTVTSDDKDTSKDGLNSLDAGIYLGVGYELENGLSFGARWCKGFTDLTDDQSNSVNSTNTNSVFQISVGFNLARF